jgi:hypothetical protein
MKKQALKNISASVHARLLNIARDAGQDFNLLLIRFALERFLQRLSVSKYREQLILKGAMLFVAWEAAVGRPTHDLDLLCIGRADIGWLEDVFREICSLPAENDGLIFDPSSVQGAAIREGALADGVRMKLIAFLGSARIPLQVDVGFGDAVVPAPKPLEFPTLLGHANPSVLAYAPEVVVAEKFHAMSVRGLSNSRLKDYFDIWRMMQAFQFDLEVISSAIVSTFEKRQTVVPHEIPEGLGDDYASRWAAQWDRLADRYDLEEAPPPLSEVVDRIRGFLSPVFGSIRSGSKPKSTWIPGKGWQ